jgi:hypothetical protein
MCFYYAMELTLAFGNVCNKRSPMPLFTGTRVMILLNSSSETLLAIVE